MSVRWIGWAFDTATGSSSSKLVLVKLADNANDDGLCWPSQNRMASDCEMTRESVNRHVKTLSDLGLIEIIPRFKDGVQLPNAYRLLVEGGGGKSDRGCDSQSQGGVTGNHRGCDNESHLLTVNEPSFKPSEGGPTDDTTPDFRKTDYNKIEVLPVEDYGDISNPLRDPIALAMAVTGETAKAGWGYWVKVLTSLEAVRGRHGANRAFREALVKTYAENKAGECKRPGAVFNLRLRELLKEKQK
jgi:biotin operon repressor